MFRRKNYFNSVVKSLSSVSTPATLIVPAGWDFWTGQVRPDTWHQNSKSSSIGVQSRFTRISHPFSRHPPSFRKIVTDAISSRNGLFDAFVMLPHSPPEPDFYNPKKTKARLVCAERKYGPWCFQALYTATKIEAGFFISGRIIPAPDQSGRFLARTRVKFQSWIIVPRTREGPDFLTGLGMKVEKHPPNQ
jgi:hypothetical protein